MRKIMFRGKRKDIGEWVVGDLVHNVYKIGDTCVGTYGSEIGMHQVDPASVGQITGETDSNDVYIFEGDIVSHAAYNFPLVVKWDGCGFELRLEETYIDRLDKYSAQDCTVIGNIHDNPELLEGGG